MAVASTRFLLSGSGICSNGAGEPAEASDGFSRTCCLATRHTSRSSNCSILHSSDRSRWSAGQAHRVWSVWSCLVSVTSSQRTVQASVGQSHWRCPLEMSVLLHLARLEHRTLLIHWQIKMCKSYICSVFKHRTVSLNSHPYEFCRLFNCQMFNCITLAATAPYSVEPRMELPKSQKFGRTEKAR